MSKSVGAAPLSPPARFVRAASVTVGYEINVWALLTTRIYILNGLMRSSNSELIPSASVASPRVQTNDSTEFVVLTDVSYTFTTNSALGGAALFGLVIGARAVSGTTAPVSVQLGLGPAPTSTMNPMPAEARP